MMELGQDIAIMLVDSAGQLCHARDVPVMRQAAEKEGKLRLGRLEEQRPHDDHAGSPLRDALIQIDHPRGDTHLIAET